MTILEKKSTSEQEEQPLLSSNHFRTSISPQYTNRKSLSLQALATGPGLAHLLTSAVGKKHPKKHPLKTCLALCFCHDGFSS